jgi:hypothetical protein
MPSHATAVRPETISRLSAKGLVSPEKRKGRGSTGKNKKIMSESPAVLNSKHNQTFGYIGKQSM